MNPSGVQLRPARRPGPGDGRRPAAGPGRHHRHRVDALGVPVVVPDDSASKAHVAAANGGLWYRDVGELFDAVRVLVHSPIGAKLAQQGRSYALAKHGDIDDFVAPTATLVLGGDPGGRIQV